MLGWVGVPWYGPMYLWSHYGATVNTALQFSDAQQKALYDAFDAELYANLYADVVAVYGTETDALFEHFIRYGMRECRKMCAGFDILETYQTRMDLRELYQEDWEKYYLDYAQSVQY